MKSLKRIGAGSGLMALALVLGLTASAAAYLWLDGQGQEAAQEAAAKTADAPTRTVVVARTEVPAGVQLTSAMLTTKDVPLAAVLDGAIRDTGDAVGRVTRYPLAPGEQLLPSRLVGDDTAGGEGLAFSVPPGMRAVSVPVTEVSGAGGLIVPGDRVDVLVSTEYANLFGPFELMTAEGTTNAGARHPTVVTVLQDALILAVGQQTTPPIDGQRDPATLRPETAEVQPQATSVTLAVTPQQAQALFLASQHGTLGLALRAFGDTDSTVLNPLFKIEPLAPPSGSLAAAQ